MIDAMKQALEALKRLNDIDGMYSWESTEQALRQAIAEAEKESTLQEISDIGQEIEQEPVAQCTNSDTWNCKYCRRTETC
jgi:hypothetical protein